MSDSNLNPQPLPPEQQPQSQQPYQQPYQGAPAARGYNTMAIVGFILAFFVNIVGIILGFVALSQIKRTGEQGRGLAIAAIIIGFAEIILGIVFFVIIVAVVAANPNTYTY